MKRELNIALPAVCVADVYSTRLENFLVNYWSSPRSLHLSVIPRVLHSIITLALPSIETHLPLGCSFIERRIDMCFDRCDFIAARNINSNLWEYLHTRATRDEVNSDLTTPRY